MRFFSAADNRLPRVRPPLRPNALAISDRFMTSILLSGKQKATEGPLVGKEPIVPTPSPTRDDRIELGASREETRIPAAAAAYERLELTTFVMRMALPAAEEVVARHERIRLSARDMPVYWSSSRQSVQICSATARNNAVLAGTVVLGNCVRDGRDVGRQTRPAPGRGDWRAILSWFVPSAICPQGTP